MELEFRDEYVGGHSGQENYELGLYINDSIVGLVEYVLFDGELTISNIIVIPEQRRKGYGSKMMNHIKNLHPEYTYKPSMKTDLGSLFKHKELSEVRRIVRNVLRESVISETYTAQKELEEFTNKILKDLARSIIERHKIESEHSGYSSMEKKPFVDGYMFHTRNEKYTGEEYDEIKEFSKSIISVGINSRINSKGRLRYVEPDSTIAGREEAFRIELHLSKETLDSIEDLFRNTPIEDIEVSDLYFIIFYPWYSTLLHELQHSYDGWRSKGKAFNQQYSQSYADVYEKWQKLKGKEVLTPEEYYAVKKGEDTYLNLVHEINARFAQALQRIHISGMDSDFNDVQKPWKDVYSAFKVEFDGWRILSDKMKRKLSRRLAKAYQEENEKLKTAVEKYGKEEVESVMNENLQLADKIYFKTGKLSPKVREIMVSHKMTGGDAWTKLVADIYMAYLEQSDRQGEMIHDTILFKDEDGKQEPYVRSTDVLQVETWREIRDLYHQLKSYNKNVFPIEGFNINGVKDIWSLIRGLKQRAQIIEEFKELPSIAIRNMKDDIRTPRSGGELNTYRAKLETFMAHYSQLGNRDKELRDIIHRKMFKKGVDLYELLDFVEEKENLIGGANFDKDMIRDIINNGDSQELEIIHEKGDIMVVEVSGPYGIKEIGCNSLWCFTYGKGHDRNWSEYSYNDTVYAIIDFSEPSDSPEFMYVLIKPIDWDSEEEGANDEKIFDMKNDGYYDARNYLDSVIGREKSKELFTFYIEPEEEEEEEEKEFVDPNQMSLFEIRRIIRGVLSK